MKCNLLMLLKITVTFITLYFPIQCNLNPTSSFLQFEESVALESLLESGKRHKKNRKFMKIHKTAQPPAPGAGGSSSGSSTSSSGSSSKGSNYTINATMYKALNQTYPKHEYIAFKKSMNSFDYKIITKQLEDIFTSMRRKDTTYKTMADDRGYMNIFINEYMSCDANQNNALEKEEFVECMGKDSYLKDLKPPEEMYASIKNMTNASAFYEEIFKTLDIYNSKTLNFHAYMELRFMIFSWRECSVVGPFIEEIFFECAVNLISDSRTLPRTTIRNLYYNALELSGSSQSRNLDFIGFLYFAQSIRIFSSINKKYDHDINKNEFSLALDENILPKRYNKELVDTLFKLMNDKNQENSGIDLISYVYYDFMYRLYEKYSNTTPWRLNSTEFFQALSDDIFPVSIINEIKRIPEKNLTKENYQLLTYNNITNFYGEGDYFMKFIQTKEKATLLNNAKLKNNNKNLMNIRKSQLYMKNLYYNNIKLISTANLTAISNKIFDTIDTDNDGFITFYDYGLFFQVSYIFGKVDTLNKGRLLASECFEKFSSWSGYPTVSDEFKKRAKRFNNIKYDNYIDLHNVLIIMGIDDLMAYHIRNDDKTLVNEIELKQVFAKINLRYIDDSHLNNCVRGLDNSNIPQYDWECTFLLAIQENITLEESIHDFNLQKANNITLYNTVFINNEIALPNIKDDKNAPAQPK